MQRSWHSVAGPVAPLTLLVGLGLAFLVFAARGHWEVGLIGFGGVLGLAALFRISLPASWLGPLVVRSRAFDFSVLVVLAAALIALSLDIPH